LIRVVCFAGALLWILIVATDRGLLDRFELAALDTELHLAPAPHASPEVMIMAIDERAVHRYGPLRWPPSLMAKVITALDRAGAGVIALDFIFSSERGTARPGVTAPHDIYQPLREALQQSGKAVLGIYFDFEPDPESLPASPEFREQRMRRVLYLGGATPQAAPPIPVATDVHTVTPELASAAHAYGHINLIPSGDGIIRWMPLLARYNDELYADVPSRRK